MADQSQDQSKLESLVAAYQIVKDGAEATRQAAAPTAKAKVLLQRIEQVVDRIEPAKTEK